MKVLVISLLCMVVVAVAIPVEVVDPETQLTLVDIDNEHAGYNENPQDVARSKRFILKKLAIAKAGKLSLGILGVAAGAAIAKHALSAPRHGGFWSPRIYTNFAHGYPSPSYIHSQTFGPDATDIGTQTFGEPVDFTNFNGGGENSVKSDDIALFVSTKKFPEGTTFDQLKNPLNNEPYHYDAHGLNGIPANHKLSPSLKTAPDFHHQSPSLKDFASKSPSLKVEPARDLKESWPKKVGPSIPIRTHRTANFANHAPILSAAPSFNQRAPPTFTASNPKPIAAKQSFGCNLK